jgi:hypothetical protein
MGKVEKIVNLDWFDVEARIRSIASKMVAEI